jgi:hypothetical protein
MDEDLRLLLQDALLKLNAKNWDMPTQASKMEVVSYDTNDNPTRINFSDSNNGLLFYHTMTYDSNGRLLTKTITEV